MTFAAPPILDHKGDNSALWQIKMRACLSFQEWFFFAFSLEKTGRAMREASHQEMHLPAAFPASKYI
jgi:hypothetical protein